MLPSSKKLIPGEVQIESGAVSSTQQVSVPSRQPLVSPGPSVCDTPRTDGPGTGRGLRDSSTASPPSSRRADFRPHPSLTVGFKETPSVHDG